jgi:hypothetical protein
MAIELESHLDDPIVKIKLYGPQGVLLVQVEDRDYDRKDMGRMGMMDFMFRIGEEEVDSFDIMDNGVLLGKLNITKQSSAESSVIAMMFKSRLFINSLISTGFAIVITLLVGAYISKRMSKDLTDTAQLRIKHPNRQPFGKQTLLHQRDQSDSKQLARSQHPPENQTEKPQNDGRPTRPPNQNAAHHTEIPRRSH